MNILKKGKYKKRIISVILCLFLLAGALPAKASSKGDVNGDGEIMLSDVLLALRCCAGQITLTKNQLNLADMNGDGEVSLEDAKLILQSAADVEPEMFLANVSQITPYKKQYTSDKAKFCVVKEYCAETLPDTYTADKSSPLYTPLPEGTFDYITSGPVKDSASGKSFYYLKSGRRVYAHEVKTFTGYKMPNNKIELNNVINYEENSTSVYLNLDWRVPFTVTVKPQEYETGYNSRPYNNADGQFTGSYMDIKFYYTKSAEDSLSFPESDTIKSCRFILDEDNKTATLRIYFRNAGEFYGYTTYYDDQNHLVISVKEPLEKLRGKVIEIDPGHGGNQPGAGSGTGVYEKDITYKIALKLKAYLEAGGATVIFSRDNSKSVPEIEERRLNTLEKDPDMLISIHLDASESSGVSGSSVYYYKNYSGPLAESVNKYLPSTVKSKTGYAMKARGAHFYPFCVTRVENCPAILVECGFITNSGDFKIQNSSSGQDAIARGIYNGIVKYMTA